MRKALQIPNSIEIAQSGFIKPDLLYEDVAEDIERLVSMKVNLYMIPGFDREDVAQEIRMVCVKAIAKYDASKTPFHFLARCADNRLRNLVRDNAATLPKNKIGDKRAMERVRKKKALHAALSVGHDIPVVARHHAVYLATPGVQITHHSAHIGLRDHNFDIHNRFQKKRCAF